MAEIDKTLFQKEVNVPLSGQKFLIRRVRFKEFIQQLGGLPLAVNPTVQDIISQLEEKSKNNDTAAEDKVLRFYVERGVVMPKVWFGDDAICPEDQIYFGDLGSDLDILAGEIIAYSGAAALKNMDNFFREPGAGAGGPNGTPLQPAPVKSDAGADV